MVLAGTNDNFVGRVTIHIDSLYSTQSYMKPIINTAFIFCPKNYKQLQRSVEDYGMSDASLLGSEYHLAMTYLVWRATPKMY